MKIKSLFLGTVILTGMLANAEADNMAPPPPIQNAVLDSMVGEWQGDSIMMGKPMHDKLEIAWGLNHQYLIMNLKTEAKDDSKISYEGLGVFGIDSKGDVKTWWFDSWGAVAASTGIGKFVNNQLVLKDGNPMFSEVRTFTVKGNEMIMHAKGMMKPDGKKSVPFEATTLYKK